MDPTCGLDFEKKILPLLGLIPRSVSLVTVRTMLSQSCRLNMEILIPI
jgi:hypothetical protein